MPGSDAGKEAPSPRGIPQIEVTFDIDANGIINVSAKDLGTGREKDIRIIAANKLKKTEIEEMRKSAELYAKEDEKHRKEIETINSADALVYSTEKLLGEMADKVSGEKKENIQKDLDSLKELLKKKEKDIAEIDQQMEALNKKVHEASTELYQKAAQEYAAKKQASAAPGQDEPPEEDEKSEKGGRKSGKKDDDNVVDAEFSEEKDEKDG